MVISGGAGTLLGPIVGAALVVIIKNVVSAYVARWNFMLGAIFVLSSCSCPRAWCPARCGSLAPPGARRTAINPPTRAACRADCGAEAMSALAVRKLSKSFGGLRVTTNVNLAVEPGERRLIIGPNGAGKTTLFNLITGEIAADAGAISLFGHDITRPPTRRRAHLGMARTYQIITLFPRDTILRNVTLALLGLSPLRWNPWLPLQRQHDVIERARAALKRVGLDHMAERPLAETSYGERRRVEIAMALAQEPRVLLLDEPFAGLSIDERRDVRELLKAIPRDVTIVMIEHDMDVALDFADRITLSAFRRGDRRGHPRRSGGRSAHAGGLSWRITRSASATSTPITATATCCRTCRSSSAKAGCLACSAATAPANRPA